MAEKELAKTYEPKSVEDKWYGVWEKGGLFRGAAPSDKPAYSIVIPPPNITGVLHMGHALNNTLQDILCRWKRMSRIQCALDAGDRSCGHRNSECG